MTGAPRKSDELIDSYDEPARTIFPAPIGCVNPSGDFDFNVVIRSLFYNAATRYLSFKPAAVSPTTASRKMSMRKVCPQGEAMMQILGR